MRHRSLGLVAIAALFEGGLLVVAVVLGALLDTSPFWTFEVGGASVAWGVGATAPLLVGLAWLMKAGWQPFDQLTDQVADLLSPLLLRGSVLGFALISLMAGLAEEALFRGVLQTALADGLGTTVAIVTAGALFGLAHAITPLYAALATLVGVYLGLVFQYSGNLAAPMLAHAIYDFVALTWLAHEVRGRAGSTSVPGRPEGEEREPGVEAAEVVAHDVHVRGERERLRQPDVVPDPEAE